MMSLLEIFCFSHPANLSTHVFSYKLKAHENKFLLKFYLIVFQHKSKKQSGNKLYIIHVRDIEACRSKETNQTGFTIIFYCYRFYQFYFQVMREKPKMATC